MKVKELLHEMPLPADWDKSVYKSTNSFAKRIKYAQERAKKVGTGSSRVAFVVEYEGRPTVLKIAKNKKGIGQNDFESQMFNDYYFTGMNMSIPMIDHDEENEPPTWIHTEYAKKMRPTQFKMFFGGLTPNEVVVGASVISGKGPYKAHPPEQERFEKIAEDNEYVNNLINIIGSYDIAPQDFTRLANWGVYKNRPVIIDIGHSSDVMTQYYSK